MEDYKQRMIIEFNEFEDKYIKLCNIILKYYHNELDFKLSCPINVLVTQSNIMGAYLTILRYRAELEGVNLNESEE